MICCRNPFEEIEDACGHHSCRLQTVSLAAYSAGSRALLMAVCWVVFGDRIAVAVLRRFIGRWRISVLTGRLLGPRLAWAAPLAVLPVLIFWGYGWSEPRWWEFTARPVGEARVGSCVHAACRGCARIRGRPVVRTTASSHAANCATRLPRTTLCAPHRPARQ